MEKAAQPTLNEERSSFWIFKDNPDSFGLETPEKRVSGGAHTA